MAPIYIGAIAGVLCYLALGIKTALKLDDSLDVIAVHLVGGLLGSILLGFFADAAVNPVVVDEGVFLGGGATLLGDQVVAAVVTLVYSFVVSLIIGKAIDMTMGLRVTPAVEDEGLDLRLHAEQAYVKAEASAWGPGAAQRPPALAGGRSAPVERLRQRRLPGGVEATAVLVGQVEHGGIAGSGVATTARRPRRRCAARPRRAMPANLLRRPFERRRPCARARRSRRR